MKKEEILDISTIKPFQILRVEEKKNQFFCIVQSNVPASVSKEDIRSSIREKSNEIIEIGCHHLQFMIFSIENGTHSVHLINRHFEDDTFTSIKDKEYSYKFFIADMGDVNAFLEKQKSTEINKAVTEFTTIINNINNSHDAIVGNTLKKVIQ